MSEYKFDIMITSNRFYNEASNWGVFGFSTLSKDDIPHLVKDDFDNVRHGVVAGSVQMLEVGAEYSLRAIIEYNKKFKSYNFVPITCSPKVPTTIDEQKRFLESIATYRETKLLLEAYPNLVDMILNNEEVDVSQIKGIGDKTLEKIKTKVLDNYVLMDLLVMLSPHGITYNQIKKIATLESNPMLIKKRIEENPYILTEINGMGFKKVDKIALKIDSGLLVSELRAKEYVKYILDEFASGDGHTVVSRNKIIAKARKDIKECMDIIKDIFDNEEEEQTFLFVDGKTVGSLKYYRQEASVLTHLNRIENSESRLSQISKEEIDKIIVETEKEQGFEFTEKQKEAVHGSVKSNVLVISGNAGSGKTTLVNCIYKVLSRLQATTTIPEDYDNGGHTYQRRPVINQCSLSAKASRRMIETTGRNATTIHRLLKWTGGSFSHDTKNPLDTDIVIADEFSMNNIGISNALFKAIPNGSKLILVGDVFQLPAIGAGAPLYDLLTYSNFTRFSFTEVHRQGLKSGILKDANKIRVNKNPIKEFKSKIVSGELKDMIYIFKNDKNSMRDFAIKSYLSAIEKFGINNVAIIVPRKQKVINSSIEINKILQEKLVPRVNGEYLQFGDKEFRVGDKIIQKVNNYDYDVVNGESGFVRDIYEEVNEQGNTVKMMKNDYGLDILGVDKNRVKFVEYEMSEIGQLELFYGGTVHSWQGSQVSVVIGIIDGSHYKMLDSTLLYTLITRASEKCLLIGDTKSFKQCITTNKTIVRNTFLSKFLTGELQIKN